MADDLKPLIAELESAKEGSRKLSDKVLLACGWRYEKVEDGIGFSGKPQQRDAWIDPTGVPWMRSVASNRPSPTESLDDAVAMVPEQDGSNLAGFLAAVFGQQRIGDIPDKKLAIVICRKVLKVRA